MRIKKVSQTTATQAQVVNNENNSQLNTYSCDYINNNVSKYNMTTGQSIKTNYKSDGDDVYVLRVYFENGPSANSSINIDTGLTNKTIDDIRGVVGTNGDIPIIVPDAYTRFRYRTSNGRIYFDNVSSDNYASAGYLDVYYH